MIFHEQLKQLRTDSGKNQIDIANYLGVSVQSYSAYETGREPKYALLIKLAEYFNVSMEYLLCSYEKGDAVFHERLKALREETGMNQKDFAASLGMEQSKYNKWENGKNAPGYDDLCRLSDCFDCSVDYMLGRTDMRHYEPDKKDETIRALTIQISELQARIDKIRNLAE